MTGVCPRTATRRWSTSLQPLSSTSGALDACSLWSVGSRSLIVRPTQRTFTYVPSALVVCMRSRRPYGRQGRVIMTGLGVARWLRWPCHRDSARPRPAGRRTNSLVSIDFQRTTSGIVHGFPRASYSGKLPSGLSLSLVSVIAMKNAIAQWYWFTACCQYFWHFEPLQHLKCDICCMLSVYLFYRANEENNRNSYI